MFKAALKFTLNLACPVLLLACAPSKSTSISDIYELPSTVPVDNDSYYRQPIQYKGCSMINDAPSCGGG